MWTTFVVASVYAYADTTRQEWCHAFHRHTDMRNGGGGPFFIPVPDHWSESTLVHLRQILQRYSIQVVYDTRAERALREAFAVEQCKREHGGRFGGANTIDECYHHTDEFTWFGIGEMTHSEHAARMNALGC